MKLTRYEFVATERGEGFRFGLFSSPAMHHLLSPEDQARYQTLHDTLPCPYHTGSTFFFTEEGDERFGKPIVELKLKVMMGPGRLERLEVDLNLSRHLVVYQDPWQVAIDYKKTGFDVMRHDPKVTVLWEKIYRQFMREERMQR